MSELQVNEQYINFQDQQIFVKDWQPNVQNGLSPIIMLHESLGSVEIWRDFPARVAQATQRQVIVYDRLGFGKSSKRTDQIDLYFIALEFQQGLGAVIQHFNLTQYVLLGHSVGAGMSVCAAEQDPQHCKAVVSIAAQAYVTPKTTNGVRDAKEMFKDPNQIKRLEKYHADRAQWVLEAWTETWLSEPYKTWTLEPNLAKIDCPILALHGEHDEFGGLEQPQRMADLVHPRHPSVCAIIEGAGHVPHKDKPEAVLAVIAEFLKDKP